ncbi:hypothetical protein BU25DRAFT_217480 [Macroventuria anomochaeta]|uniref:Uncharacterized protein n=1 Tax=Macroventuria anomochaeta TaxID=301207 RepID=A0ACB6RJW6_9PLEO|nr:uncharacterized protein BU25DRAFT_217480 [Macroventuria anomochaeta]KAF2622200.1 hypothetical protein BU25DRAFT_217480 [Macroventuria anomochaeta]
MPRHTPSTSLLEPQHHVYHAARIYAMKPGYPVLESFAFNAPDDIRIIRQPDLSLAPCDCMNKHPDLGFQGLVARAVQQFQKASHAMFCVTTEYKQFQPCGSWNPCQLSLTELGWKCATSGKMVNQLREFTVSNKRDCSELARQPYCASVS